MLIMNVINTKDLPAFFHAFTVDASEESIQRVLGFSPITAYLLETPTAKFLAVPIERSNHGLEKSSSFSNRWHRLVR